MAVAARWSGLVESALEGCTSEAVACRTWLGQQSSAGGGRRADRNEYMDELIFFII
jgi:hypothetical protein